MARSLLGSFVNGTRQMLAVQLFISVSTVALAGYTAMVTNRAIAERNRLNERVIQLEQTLGEADIVPPEMAIPVETPTETLYPPSLEGAATTTVTPEDVTPEDTTTATQDPAPPTTAPPVRQPPPTRDETPATTTTTTPLDEAKPETQATPTTPAFDPAQLLRDLLTPPPALRTVVLHVRAQSDADEAQRVARALAANSNLAVTIDVMPAGDTRESGYAYFHGRQGNAAASVVQRFQEAARAAEIAPWVAQLRGAALPASGEYTADRVDIVLPPLPAPRPELRAPLNRRLQNYQVLPQQQPPIQ
jgi:hypothetical protein